MIIMICVGCATIVGALVVVAYRAIMLFKSAKRAGISSMGEAQALVRRSQNLVPRLRETAASQKELAERLESLSATKEQWNYLMHQLDEATGHISKLKS